MPALNQDAYDITIVNEADEEIGLVFYNDPDPKRTPGVESEFVGAVQGIEPTRRPQPESINDFSGGAGYARDFYPGTYSYGIDVDTMSGALMPAGYRTSMALPAAAQSAQVTRIIEYAGDLYFAAGRYILRSASGTDAIGTDHDLGVGVTAGGLAVINSGATLLVGTNGYLRAREGGVYTTSANVSGTQVVAVYWTPSGPSMATADAGLGGFRVVSNDSGISWRYCADGNAAFVLSNANWAPASGIRIGEGGNAASPTVNTIVSTGHHVYFVRADGVWDVDAAARSVRLLDFTDSQHSDNGLCAIVQNEWLYVGHHQGLRRYNLNLAASGRRQDVPGACEPGAGAHANESVVFGTCTALTRWNGWLVAAFYNGGDSHIMFGRDRTEFDRDVPGAGPMVWHGAYAYYDNKRVTAMHVSAPGGVPRLWVALWDGSTSTVEWVSLPKAQTALQDLVSAGAHRYQTSASLYTANQTWGEPTAKKHLWTVDVNAERLDGTTYVQIYAQKDSDGTWTQQGGSFNTTPGDTTLATITDAKQVQFRIDLTGSTTAPPVVRAIRPSADILHEQAEVRDVVVWFGPQVALRNGRQDDRDSTYIMGQLRQLVKASIVDVYDEEGSKYTAKILPGLQVRKIQDRSDNRWTYIVSFSYRIQTRVAYWGAGVWGEFYWT